MYAPVLRCVVSKDEIGRVSRAMSSTRWDGIVRVGAIGPRHRRARNFADFGDGIMIAFPPTVIFGEGRITLGAGTTIGPLASISAGMPSQARSARRPDRIGDRCTLGKGSASSAHERIELGDDIWTGHYVYVTDQNHGYEDVDLPIGTQMWSNEPVSIGDGSWLGHGAVVLPGSKIGRNVVIAAGAVVAGIEVPDYSVVAGVPARVIRRYVDGIWKTM